MEPKACDKCSSNKLFNNTAPLVLYIAPESMMACKAMQQVKLAKLAVWLILHFRKQSVKTEKFVQLVKNNFCQFALSFV